MAYKKLCKKAGCNRLATDGHKYCDLHQHLERAEEERRLHWRPDSRYTIEWPELYNNSKWKEMSRNFLKNFPTCAVCGGKATEVHHKIAHRGNVDLFYNEDNLVSLCHDCHSKETIREINNRKREQSKEYQMRKRHNILTDNYKAQ